MNKIYIVEMIKEIKKDMIIYYNEYSKNMDKIYTKIKKMEMELNK